MDSESFRVSPGDGDNTSSQRSVRGLPTPPVEHEPTATFADTTALLDSADARFQKYQEKRSVKVLNTAGNTLGVIRTDVAQVQSFASPLQVVLDSDPAKALRQTVAALVDGIPALLKVLDDVAQIHPFIKVAIGAFRVAVELDLKRRDNDKKIPLLFAEMRDMMAVLVQLGEIAQDQRVGTDNKTIEDRMGNLVKKTEEDIRKCANACSAYSKKHTFSKVLQSSSWDETFKGYIQGFTTRRGEFEFELSLYVGRAVNTANDRLVTLDEKMDRLLKFFEACVSPEERYLADMVRNAGGPEVVINDQAVLRKLYEDKGRPLEHRATGRHDPEDDFQQLQEELRVDPETAIRDNLEQFERKFRIQQRELEEEMRRMMHREGDRIIDSFTAGPHDRIRDWDIHEIWKDMRWRGNVKARHFVLALRDYFSDRMDEVKRVRNGETSLTPPRPISEEDEWTLEYINITRLQPIAEAFDDDASGFITVAEVNAFTQARPDDWSLLHWLAYWAIGYQMVMSDYAAKIDVILAKMFSLKAQVLPANRNAVEQYLNHVWTMITMLTSAFRRTPIDESVMSKFESYTKQEENRLRQNLKDVKYDFDARDTVDIVRGPGRIEKHIFPLLYLILLRDFEIMRIARKSLLHVDELYDAVDTIVWACEAVEARCEDLNALFRQQKLDPKQQFKMVAFEMFKFVNDEDEFTSMKNMKEGKFVEQEYRDEEEAQDVDANSIINHPLLSPEVLFARRDSIDDESDAEVDPHIHPILGRWSGFYINNFQLYPCDNMLALDLRVSSTNPKQFQDSGIAANGTYWTLTGEYNIDPESGKVTYTFAITYQARWSTESFRGELQPSGTELSGTLGYGAKPTTMPFTFVFKRLSCDRMRFWPSPKEFAENKNRALWRFACRAVLDETRHRMSSWACLRERWDNTRRYVALLHKRSYTVTSVLTAAEQQQFSDCCRNMTPEEARLAYIYLDLRKRSIPQHFMIICDACGDSIRGGRVMCLSCGTKFTIDLCDKPECCDKEIGTDVRDDLTSPHLPTHDLFKVRTAIHPFREFGQAHRAALMALKMARRTLSDAWDVRTAERSTPQKADDDTAAAGKKPENVPRVPTCSRCGDKIGTPCWYCIECKDDDATFICVACDTKYGGLSVGQHRPTHALVKVQSLEPLDPSASERAAMDARMTTIETSLKELQSKLEEYKLEQKFVAVDEKIEYVQKKLDAKLEQQTQQLKGRISTIDDRLKRMEDILLFLGQRLGRADEAGRSEVRQSTWPEVASRQHGTFSAVGGYGESNESDFSAWVRQMRTSSSTRPPAASDGPGL
ncbi:hypothetical protein L226DRAFT_469232 [Lentinus tigrinus ALCF2SS1-7]|uniref:EF-hand domain-containing protein n=1 Tax=Lentinus tigrinus ALCF2SS1-6 TaxID=1328759 RepID=A0A5C2RZ60_9APHY|nr:hypothetical protein L227DRAFT_508717 [Lentinus tigrinus ALCF2SS1-6]RPD71099.1 hypothetical protein L226DRAFT_469232 [Lentinus tigrinus ALCF2SS1-7]